MDKESGLLGFPEMDEQHKYLYGIFSLLEQGTVVIDTEATRTVLKEIERYVNFHFTCEEHLMRIYEFPGFAIHQSDHEQAAMRLISFMDDFDEGKLNPAALCSFLRNWLWEHSAGSDTEYVRWINAYRSKLQNLRTRI